MVVKQVSFRAVTDTSRNLAPQAGTNSAATTPATAAANSDHGATATPAWAAPTCSAPFDATVVVPGSKSISNRAFILAALGDGTSHIFGALLSRDTVLMMAALRTLGVAIEQPEDPAEPITVTPGPRTTGEIDCGLAGTVMRFVPPVAALSPGAVHFDGDPHARNRPMSTMTEALRQLGAEVSNDALPFTLVGNNPQGGVVEIDASASSQFVSGLLLAGAAYPKGITIIHTGANVPSMPHIEMTVDMLRRAGVRVSVDLTDRPTWTVEPGPITASNWIIEPDLSNATPFMAAAALTGSTVRIPHWPQVTTQPGDEMRGILAEMGAEVSLTDGVLTVTGTGTLRGIDRDLSAIGELTPTIAALAALASTPSRLTGIGHLRGHETDRLAALANEINALGGSCEEGPDFLAITPAPLHGGLWHAYADHRMATAGAIIGLVTPGVMVDDIDSTSKTLPDFARMWQRMLGAAETPAEGV